MKLTITVTLDISPMWAYEYGISSDDVPSDVATWLETYLNNAPNEMVNRATINNYKNGK